MKSLLSFFNATLQCLGRTEEQRLFEEKLYAEGLQKEEEKIIEKLNKITISQEIARKFLLVELDILRTGDTLNQNFVETSGFHVAEYLGTTKNENSHKEIEYIQLIFINFLNQISNEKQMFQSSMNILNGIMEHWEIGKYSEEGQLFIKEYTNNKEPSLEKENVSLAKEDVSLAEEDASLSLIPCLKNLQNLMMNKLIYADEKIQKLLDTYFPPSPQETIKKTEEKRVEQTVKKPEEEIEKPKEHVKLYTDKKVYALMEEHNHVIEDIITGEINPENYEEIKTFQEQISLAAMEGNNLASVFCPFFMPNPSFPTLPLPITTMDEKSKKFFMDILNSFQAKGFSTNLQIYLQDNRDYVYNLATEDDRFMQHLIDFWYEPSTEKANN